MPNWCMNKVKVSSNDKEELTRFKENVLDEGFNLKDFKKVYYFQNKRWDVEIKEGLIVKLPRKNIKEAVNKMKLVLENDQFNINKTIDLRIPNQIIIN